MATHNKIEQRVDDFYGFIARHRLRLMDVVEKANLNYNSVKVNLRNYNVSKRRMNLLENAAIRLAGKSKKGVAADHS